LPIQLFVSLRSGNARVKPAAIIHRYVMTADREPVAVHKTPAGEHRNGGGACPYVDQGSTEVSLVVGEHGQSRRVGARHQGTNLQVATLYRQYEVARHRDVGGHGMHIDAKAAPDHAARIADAGHFVERIADRQRMEHGTARPGRTECWLPAESTRVMSPSETVLSATLTVAAMSSLDGLPAESDTTTDFSCRFAARSARSSAWRSVCSTSTRSITAPAFM